MRLEFLRHLYEGSGRCASVYLDTPLTGEYTAGEVAQHWHDASGKLKLDGAGAATLDALGAVIGDAGQAPGLAAFARSGRAELARPLPAAPPREIASYAPLPHVLPMLALAPPEVPHLLVTADRSGGEIISVTGLDQDSAVTRVEGDGWPVHKARAGGWSQARYQRSAEEAWATNEKEFAAAVTAAAERAGAELIVLAGDVRARAILLDHLGRPVRDTVVVVDKEIPPGSDLLAEEATAEITRRAEQASREGLDSVRTQLPRGRAAEGFGDVVAVLREGRVARLFLGEPFLADLFGADDPAVLWFGSGPGELATSADELRDLGIAEPISDRADAALVRGLVLTGGDLHFVPSDEPNPRDGIAALLR
jgi:Bacterial archaeo-eukaryotic release factor family 2